MIQSQPTSAQPAPTKPVWISLDGGLMIRFLVVFVLVVMPSALSFAQSTAINFDSGDLITQINIWLPTFMPIMAIGAGIAIAIALIDKVTKAILNGIG